MIEKRSVKMIIDGRWEILSSRLDQLIGAIPSEYTVIAPVKEKWAANLAPIASAAELAVYVGSNESPGAYELLEGPGQGHLSGVRPMNSPKQFTHRPRETVLKARRSNGRDYNYETPEPAEKLAFFGLHACDVAGMSVLDRTFQQGYLDPQYNQRRRDNLIIGVNCFAPGNNCFCSTFNTGPALTGGFDIALSDFGDRYLAEAGSEAGAALLAETDCRPADMSLVEEKNRRLEAARRAMPKAFDLEKATTALNGNYDHPYWQEPSSRCLSCANCINVCPTCYCYQMSEQSDLTGSEIDKIRSWDACQHLEFAAVHGGNFRPARKDRIRQWVNHKLNWTIEQYGVAGCVGCGRCITWCPTAIDITEPVWRLGGKEIALAE